MIRALAFAVATLAPHVQQDPSWAVILPDKTCRADGIRIDYLTVSFVGMVCLGDRIFRNGFEAATSFTSSQPLWPRLANTGRGEQAPIRSPMKHAIAQVCAAEPRVDGTRMDGKATFFMRRAGNGATQSGIKS